jgi:hypothetical protein
VLFCFFSGPTLYMLKLEYKPVVNWSGLGFTYSVGNRTCKPKAPDCLGLGRAFWARPIDHVRQIRDDNLCSNIGF